MVPRSEYFTFRAHYSRRPAARLLSILFSSLILSTALAECDEEIICIDEEVIDDQILVRAENLSDFPLTYSLRLRGQGKKDDDSGTVTRTLDARESHLVMTIDNPQQKSAENFRYKYDWTIGSKNAVHDDEYVYQLPYGNGKSYRVIQGYGSRFSHTGLEQFAIDFRMDEGTPVHAARGGVVARTVESNSIGCWRAGCGAHANFVVVLHDDGTTGEYYHLLKDGALVDVGDRVFPGQKIALSGNTGHTTIPHLHFAVYRAIEWGRTQSVPVRFATADGLIERPRRGGRYQAIPIRQASEEKTSKSTIR
jgi:murein DD-endopeptidase MepM/ murein hydrolase activator NlpD